MTCREIEQLLKREGGEDRYFTDHGELARHLKSCRRCGEAMRAARLSSVLLGALRNEITPGPHFYPRLHARLADTEIGQMDAILQAWGLAKQLIPALAVGVVLLAVITLSTGGSRPSPPVQAEGETDLHAFSLEEVNLPGAIGRPSRDQMLAFVLAHGTRCDVRGAPCEDESPR